MSASVRQVSHYCQSWEDNRLPDSVGTTIHKASGDEYGVNKDPDNLIREKAIELFFVQALFMTFVRIPYRIFQLCKGDFIHAGRVLGERKWNAAVLNYGLTSSIGEAPNLKSIVRKEICWQFVKNIVKIVTYPLAIVALQFAALVAIISPVPGRRFFALVEDLWSREFFVIKKNENEIKVSEYIARCFLPMRVWRRLELHRMFSDYRKESIRTRLTVLQNEIELNRGYYDIPVNDEMNGKQLKSLQDYFERLEYYQKNVKLISYSDFEDDEDTRNHFDLSGQLESISNSLCTIFRSRQRIFLKESGQKTAAQLQQAVKDIGLAFKAADRFAESLIKPIKYLVNPNDKNLCGQLWNDGRPKGAEGLTTYVPYVSGRYKFVYPIKDSSDASIRRNAVIAFFLQAIFMTCVRIPCRILTLISGDFIKGGIAIGTRKYDVICGRLTRGEMVGLKPSKNKLIAKEICVQLVKNIIKIVTYPLAIIGIQFCTVLALFSPLPGRRMIGEIESLWSRDRFELFNDDSSSHPVWKFTRFSDILFETCQPEKEVRREDERHFRIPNPEYEEDADE